VAVGRTGGAVDDVHLLGEAVIRVLEVDRDEVQTPQRQPQHGDQRRVAPVRAALHGLARVPTQVARTAPASTHAQALSVAPIPTNGAPNITVIAASVGDTASLSTR